MDDMIHVKRIPVGDRRRYEVNILKNPESGQHFVRIFDTYQHTYHGLAILIDDPVDGEEIAARCVEVTK